MFNIAHCAYFDDDNLFQKESHSLGPLYLFSQSVNLLKKMEHYGWWIVFRVTSHKFNAIAFQ